MSLRLASTAAALGLGSLTACRDRSSLEAPVAEPETSINIVQGNGARLNPGSQFDTIVVWVADRHGDPLAATPVAWSVTAGGGSVAPLESVTIDGFARALWTLGPNVGVNTLRVSAAMASATVTAQAAAPLKAISMAPGASHACALVSGGIAYCWGDNSMGQLGHGSPGFGSLSRTAVRVQTSVTFSTLASRAHHSCGVSIAGETICWGMAYESGPTRIAGPRFVALTTGMHHTCGLTADGAAYCWGQNESGQLGSSSSDAIAPMRVVDAPSFVSIAAGSVHTCGLTADGRVFCWGSNEYGQLAATASDTCAVPNYDDSGLIGTRSFSCSRRAILAGVNERVMQLSPGPILTCGLTVERAVVCWGAFAPAPYTVGGATGLTEIAQNGELACGLDADHRAWCWSFTGGPPWHSTPELLPGGLTFETLSGGWTVLCGTTTQDSIAYCWGWNGRGQLGDGTISSYRPQPVRVVSPADSG